MRSFQKSKHLLSCLRRAVESYAMIAPGDVIAVGLSGGKDSVALLCALSLYRRFSPVPFSLLALTVDMGNRPEGGFAPLEALGRELEVPFLLLKSDISERIFPAGTPASPSPISPCALCARLRRGILLHAAAENGCTKLALGHHADDAAVTFLMNLLNEGRLGCFSPVTETATEKGPLTLIRPLLLADEGDIRYFVRANGLPVLPSLCPMDRHTDRERVSTLLRTLEKERPGTRHRILRAMEKAGLDGWGEASPEEKAAQPDFKTFSP